MYHEGSGEAICFLVGFIIQTTRSEAGSTVYYKDCSIFTSVRTCFQLSDNLSNINQ